MLKRVKRRKRYKFKIARKGRKHIPDSLDELRGPKGKFDGTKKYYIT